MLSMLEEIVLLAVDEKTGNLQSTREFGTAYALVGAVFFDLALARRIDTDTQDIRVIDTTPTGQPVVDRFLAQLSGRKDLTTVRAWIEAIFTQRHDLEGEALGSLVKQGILRHEKSKLLWIIDVERFPVSDIRPRQSVKQRLAEAILSDGIPDTRDIMLVSIAEPCGLLPFLLSEAQLKARRQRIQTLCKLETISREVAEAIQSLDKSIRIALTKVV